LLAIISFGHIDGSILIDLNKRVDICEMKHWECEDDDPGSDWALRLNICW